MKIGDLIVVHAYANSGYLDTGCPIDVAISPVDKPKPGVHRCIFRHAYKEPVKAVFLGWNWLRTGTRQPGSSYGEEGYEGPYLQEYERVKVAMWMPTGNSRYTIPMAALPSDVRES